MEERALVFLVLTGRVKARGLRRVQSHVFLPGPRTVSLESTVIVRELSCAEARGEPEVPRVGTRRHPSSAPPAPASAGLPEGWSIYPRAPGSASTPGLRPRDAGSSCSPAPGRHGAAPDTPSRPRTHLPRGATSEVGPSGLAVSSPGPRRPRQSHSPPPTSPHPPAPSPARPEKAPGHSPAAAAPSPRRPPGWSSPVATGGRGRGPPLSPPPPPHRLASPQPHRPRPAPAAAGRSGSRRRRRRRRRHALRLGVRGGRRRGGARAEPGSGTSALSSSAPAAAACSRG